MEVRTKKIITKNSSNRKKIATRREVEVEREKGSAEGSQRRQGEP